MLVRTSTGVNVEVKREKMVSKRECKGVEVATAANDTKKTTQSIIIIEDDYIVGTSGKA